MSYLSGMYVYLKYFNFCYNTTPHTSFEYQFTSFELVYARKHNTPDILKNNNINPIYNFENYAKEAKYKLQIMSKIARDILEKTKLRTKIQYDKKSKPIDLKINDKVVVVDETNHKHEPIYSGPYLVKEIKDQNVTIIDDKNKIKTVHKNNIRKYFSR